MAFSTGFGLTCMCFIMVLFVPGQGQRQFAKTEPQHMACRQIPIECCTATSNGRMREAVNACYVQEKGFAGCKIHAYIFVTESNNTWCVDPNASWLPERLEKLQNRGITCKPFV